MQLRDAYEASDVMENGVIDSQYVNKYRYTLDTFKFKSSEASGSKTKYNFEAVIYNQNFKSEIEGHVTASSDLQSIDDFKVDKHHTVPLRGVEALEDQNDKNSSGKERAGTELSNG